MHSRLQLQSTPSVAIEVNNLGVSLIDGTTIVSEISFSVLEGQILALVGESGSGKTTIATALLAHTRQGAKISQGEVNVAGLDILKLDENALRRVRGKQVSYVPQNPSTALNPLITIKTHLEDVLKTHAPTLAAAQQQARIINTLKDVELSHGDAFLNRYPHQLSGGQQQRVLLALSFITKPSVIVLDEPTTALDVTTQAKVLLTVKKLCQSYGVAAIYVSHDLAVVKKIADHVIVLYGGRIAEKATAAAMFSHPWHPYSQGLISAIPDIHLRSIPVPIVGNAPSLQSRAKGCVFEPRCKLATLACKTIVPPLDKIDIGDDHVVACHNLSRQTDPFSFNHHTAALKSRVIQLGTQPPLLEVKHLFASYDGKQVLKDVSFHLKKGECLALVGESGSGKTTISRAIAGLNANAAGGLYFKGQSLALAARSRSAAISHQIQYIFQNPYQSLNPRQTVRQTLLNTVRHYFPDKLKDSDEIITAALIRVALDPGLADRFPKELSGGELQRVSIARALVCEPSLLICDEITSALDVSVQAAILELIKSLQRNGLSIVFVTHNLGIVRSIADRVLVLKNGAVVESGEVDTLLDQPQQPYTQELINDSPSIVDL
ncbi:ABC transporter ATP-binding protein [Methylophilus sp. UBA6697]|uniref:dipeptide ABC transporter ATP-binding protein n=1 Tax=Methylophilus sp. UBA6697 TaxID=1946902 RepID=UPI0025DBDA8D|nr:ABC transporter ATP-binding protein [Methylophilus sp. UBA6697]